MQEKKTMRAAAIDHFGGPEELKPHELPVPEIKPDEVLLHVEVAGIGSWDAFEREGGYAEMQGTEPKFPYVPGSEGAGTIAAVGDKVSGFKEGDRVYAAGFLNPNGGFYAEYVAIAADQVSHLPGELTLPQAAVMSGVATTALRGLDDTLKLKPGETILIFGAGGGIGHVTIQLAKRMGARVLAVASNDEGVKLAKQVGAHRAINGKTEHVLAAAREFAPNGIDTALLTAGGDAAELALQALRKDGRAAYPNGVQLVPKVPDGVQLSDYNGEPDADIIARLNKLIAAGPFEVHVAQTFPLDQAAEAHRMLNDSYLGKLALQVS
jgi:NADPH:quinone reductase